MTIDSWPLMGLDVAVAMIKLVVPAQFLSSNHGQDALSDRPGCTKIGFFSLTFAVPSSNPELEVAKLAW